MSYARPVPFCNAVTVMVAAILSSTIRCDSEPWKMKVQYFEKVDLDCAQFSSNTAVIHTVQAWILPSGDVWKHDADIPGKHVVVRNNGLVLTINRLDDDDFGLYYCIVDTGINGTHVIKIGVNVDGPYYGPTYLNEIKHSAMVGGIAAGCTLILLISLWLVCSYCTKERKSPSIPRTSSDSYTIDEAHTNEAMKMTQIGDNVYYNADEMKTDIVAEGASRGTLASTGSGDYHSIDSIDRNKKLRNVDPGDVYNEYVKTVHMYNYHM